MAAKLAGGGGGDRFNVEQNSEINVTPFVDVMLVLLIIFMVAAPLASVTVEVTLPPAVAKAAQNPPKPIYISIQSNGNFYLGDQRYDTAYELGDTLSREVGRRDPSKERIFIRGDKAARYGTFMEIMNSLQDRGFYSVALVGADAS
jgi:biopolymer transport protein ExbD